MGLLTCPKATRKEPGPAWRAGASGRKRSDFALGVAELDHIKGV